jgi:hypothetical protein
MNTFCLLNESIVALASLPNKAQQANFREPLGSLINEPVSNIEAETQRIHAAQAAI